MLTQFQNKNSLVKAPTDSLHPSRTPFQFRLLLIVTWIILWLPIYPLLAYTSVHRDVWNKYSVPYTYALVIYFSLLLLWPLLLALSNNKVNQISRRLTNVIERPRLQLQLIVISIILPQLILITIQLLGRDFHSLLRFSVLLVGLWLSAVPSFWVWGLSSWKKGIYAEILAVQRYMVENPIVWVRPLVVGGVLFLSAVLAFISSPSQLNSILLLLPGIAVVFTFIRWPPLGLVAVIGALLIPFFGPSGLNATMLLVALLLGLWVVDMMVRQRLRLVESPPIRPLLAFVLVATLAFSIGQLPWYTFASSAPLGAQLGGLALFILSAAAFLLVAHQVRNIRWLEAMTWALLALGGLYIVGQMVPGANPILNLFPGRSINGSMFFTWVVVLAFSQAAFNRQLTLRWRLLLIALVLLTMYHTGVQLYGWKSGWLPPLAAITAVIGFRWWRLVPVMGLVGLALGQELVSEIIASDQYSYSTRLDAWLIVTEIVKVNPISGLGPANYYWYTPLFPIRGYAVQFNSHSQYVDLFAQTGLLGLIGFLWFFAAVGWLAWRLRERVPEGFARAYVYGALGGLVGSLVAGVLGDWVISFFYNVTMWGFRLSVLPWLFLGGLVALEQMTLKLDNNLTVE